MLLWNHLPGQPKSFRSVAGGLALLGCLAAPLAYTLDTVNTPHSGAIPSAGPTGASVGAGPGGFGGPGGGTHRFPNRAFGQGFGQTPGGSTAPNGSPPNGASPGGFGRTPTGGTFGNRAGGGFGGTGGGGLLNASRPSAAMVALLEHDASKYKWVAATVGANDAAGYQLATGDAVMAIGGFNGTDPYPSLAQFEKLVQEGKVHYFIAGGGGFGGPGGAGTSSVSSAITSWVENNYSSTSVGGVTIYDLTATPSGGSR